MDKVWQQKKEEWYKQELQRRRESILVAIESCEYLDDDFKKTKVEQFKNITTDRQQLFRFVIDFHVGFSYLKDEYDNDEGWKKYEEWLKDVDLDGYKEMIDCKYLYDGSRYIDSEPVEFDGDIIITDPCYVVSYEHGITDDDWRTCDYGDSMEKLGINHYMTRDTLYGDWSCTTFNTDTEEEIGSFCADAGLVSVFALDEVLKYNPDYKYIDDWSVTYIKDFKGTVQFIVVYTDGYYEDETEWHKKGEHWEDYSVQVVGHGINKVTGEPINFVGRQTGL